MVSIVAEIGINYATGNGDFLENAKKLIDIAAIAGCDYVKFQKRYPEVCVPEKQKNKEKIVPWRKNACTYLEYKKDIEFDYCDYRHLFKYAKDKGITPFASVWDIESAKTMIELTDMVKIPSAKLTDKELLRFCNGEFPLRLISTGMSNEQQINEAIKIFDPGVIFHTNSVYPSPIEDLNLLYIQWLQNQYGKDDIEIGYSNHYYGLVPMYAAVALGVTWVEFHITENRYNWGSDQLNSIEPSGVFKLVKGIRDLEKAMKGYGPRKLYPNEDIKLKSLRGE